MADSGNCGILIPIIDSLFETFCPSDKTDEVLEYALDWKQYVDTFPDELQPQVERIWRLWTDNRAALEPIYKTLPVSVFQADLNLTNILVDDSGDFVGICDFNLCGREVFLNYLMRETYFVDWQEEINAIFDRLRIASGFYSFSELEKQAALPLYRCLKPLWINKKDKLEELKDDIAATKRYLDETEDYLTRDIDFAGCM